MSKTTAPEPSCDITEDEFFGTLTGFDELAINQKFSANIVDLTGTSYLRALIFIHRAREGGSVEDKSVQKTAKQHAMGLTIRQCTEYFTKPDPDADPDADPDDDDTPASAEGNDDEQPASALTPAPSSA